MDKDLLVLMQFLSNKSCINLVDIERGINGTRRQVTYRIEKLNEILKLKNVHVFYFSRTYLAKHSKVFLG